MLADKLDTSLQTGGLSREFHEHAPYRNGLLDFIASELPRWRDRSDLKDRTAENEITSHLCGHLNTASYRAGRNLQFRVEETDKQKKGRKIDLVASPCDAVIWIDGVRHADCDALMPIECKRLPIPKDSGRDEREYVISQKTSKSSIGGIQRFKAGHHGNDHALAGMIGYVQEETPNIWDKRIAGWINDLAGVHPGWSTADLLSSVSKDTEQGLAIFRSSHKRSKNSQDIEIRHLWIEMNHTTASA